MKFVVQASRGGGGGEHSRHPEINICSLVIVAFSRETSSMSFIIVLLRTFIMCCYFMRGNFHYLLHFHIFQSMTLLVNIPGFIMCAAISHVHRGITESCSFSIQSCVFISLLTMFARSLVTVFETHLCSWTMLLKAVFMIWTAVRSWIVR